MNLHNQKSSNGCSDETYFVKSPVSALTLDGQLDTKPWSQSGHEQCELTNQGVALTKKTKTKATSVQTQ